MPKSTFTAQEIEEIRRLLREAVNEPPLERREAEPEPGILTDEIAALRRQGMSDDDIASLMTQGAGVSITADEVRKLYPA
jgi:hypothetical protein